jgi:hypothetical protein
MTIGEHMESLNSMGLKLHARDGIYSFGMMMVLLEMVEIFSVVKQTSIETNGKRMEPRIKITYKTFICNMRLHITGDPTPPTQTTWVGGENMVYI